MAFRTYCIEEEEEEQRQRNFVLTLPILGHTSISIVFYYEFITFNLPPTNNVTKQEVNRLQT